MNMQNLLFSSISYYIKHKKIYWWRAKDFSAKKSDDPNLIIETCQRRVGWSRGEEEEGIRDTRPDPPWLSSSSHDRSLLLFIPIHVYFPGHEFTARAVIEPAGPDSFHCPRKTFRFAISPRLTAELSFEAV